MRKIAVIGIVMILLMSNLVVAPGQSDGSIRATTAVPITDPDRLQENTVYWWKAPGYVESDPTPDDPNDGYRQMVRIGDRFYGIATDTSGTPHQGVTDQPGIYLANNPDQWRLRADEGRNIQYIEDKAAVAFVDAQSQGTFSLRNGRFVLPGETAAAQGAPGATAPPAEGQGSTSGAQTAAGTGAGATPPGQQIQTRDVVQVQGKSAIVMSVNADGSLVVRNSNGDDSTVRADAVSRLYTSQEWDRIMGATEPNVYGLDILGRIDEGYTYNSATGQGTAPAEGTPAPHDGEAPAGGVSGAPPRVAAVIPQGVTTYTGTELFQTGASCPTCTYYEDAQGWHKINPSNFEETLTSDQTATLDAAAQRLVSGGEPQPDAQQETGDGGSREAGADAAAALPDEVTQIQIPIIVSPDTLSRASLDTISVPSDTTATIVDTSGERMQVTIPADSTIAVQGDSLIITNPQGVITTAQSLSLGADTTLVDAQGGQVLADTLRAALPAPADSAVGETPAERGGGRAAPPQEGQQAASSIRTNPGGSLFEDNVEYNLYFRRGGDRNQEFLWVREGITPETQKSLRTLGYSSSPLVSTLTGRQIRNSDQTIVELATLSGKILIPNEGGGYSIPPHPIPEGSERVPVSDRLFRIGELSSASEVIIDGTLYQKQDGRWLNTITRETLFNTAMAQIMRAAIEKQQRVDMTRIRPPTAQAAGAPPSAAQTELELPSLVGFEGWVVNNMPASVWVDETGRIFGSQAELTAAGGTQSTEVQPGKAFNSHNPTETMDIPGWVSGTPPAAGTPALPGTGGTPTTGQAKSVKRFARPNTDGSYTGIEIFEPVDGVRTIRVGTETVNVPEYLLEGADITRWTGAFNQDNNPTGIPLAGKTGSRNIVSDDSYHDDIQDSNGKFIGISDYTRYPSGREIIINVNNIDTPNEQTIVRQIDGDNVMETSFKPGVQNPALSDIEKITATIKGGKTTELIGSKVGELLADSAINDDMDRVFNVMSEAARLDIERITSFNPETGVLGTGTGNTYVQVLTTPNMFNVLSVKNGRATRLLDIYDDTQHFYVYSGNVRPPLDSNGNPISGNRFEIDFGQESTSIELDSNDRPVRRSIYLNENGLDTNEPLIAEYEYSYGNPDNPNDDTMLFKSGDVSLTFLNTPETFNPLSRLYQAQAIVDIEGCTMASPCWVRGTGVLDVNRDTGDRNNPVSVRQLPEEEANVFLDRLAAAKGIVGTDEEKRRKAKEILDKTDKALDADAQGDNRITRSEIDHQRFFLELETAIGNARSAGYVLGNVYSYFVNEDIIRKWQEAMESNFVTRFLTTEDAFDSAICNQFDKYELKSPSEGSAYKATPTGYDEPGAWIQATKQPFTTTGEDGARADKFLYIITFNVDMTPSSSTNTVREEVGINVGVKEQGQGFETPLLLDDGQFFPVKRERRYGRTRDTRTGGPLVFENRKNFEKACIIFDNMPFVVQGQWQVENDGKYTVCTRIKEVGGPETMEEMEARLRREQNRGQSAGGEPGADTEREAPQLSSHYWSDE